MLRAVGKSVIWKRLPDSARPYRPTPQGSLAMRFALAISAGLLASTIRPHTSSGCLRLRAARPPCPPVNVRYGDVSPDHAANLQGTDIAGKQPSIAADLAQIGSLLCC
jgi:hypothetical protein